jgi:hypothetical protein
MQVQGVEGVEPFFRTRQDKDGSIHVWAPGWRLELRFAALVPPALAIGFLLSNLPLPVRLLFSAVLVGCGIAVQRMTSIGIVLAAQEVRLVGIARTRRATWDDVEGFVGERDAHEGRPVLLVAGGGRLRAPGSLPSETMDTFWNETEVSAIDELNGIVEAFRSGEPLPPTVESQKRLSPPREEKERPPRVKTDRPPRAKRERRHRERLERIDVQSAPLDPGPVVEPAAFVDSDPVVDPVGPIDPAPVVDPAPVIDPSRSMAHAGRTGASGNASGVVPDYVAAAANRSSYPSRGAERLAEWERAHAAAAQAEKESKPRRSRRRPRS